MKKAKIDSIINILRNDTSVLAGYLFGSQIKGRLHKYSDVDIAILFDEAVKEKDYTDKQILFINRLSAVLNKEIDIIVLNKASLFLRYHILRQGIKIYERPDRREHNFEASSIIQYFDFLPIKDRIEKGVLSKIKGE